MLLSVIKGRRILLLTLIPVIATLLWIKAIKNPISISTHSNYMPLYQMLINLSNNNLLLLNILACLFIIISAYGLVYLNNKYIFIKQRVGLPALIYILITGGVVDLQVIQPAIIAVILLILALDNTFSIYNEKTTLSSSFNSGMYIGLASLFYLNASIFIVWFWISLLIMGNFRGREFISGLIGFLMPYLFVLAWYFWNDQLPQFANTLHVNITRQSVLVKIPNIQTIYLGLLALLSIFAGLEVIYAYREKYTTSRKYIMIIIWFFFFNIAGYFLFPSSGKEQYFLSAIPITYITSNYFLLKRSKRLKEILFLVLVAFSIAIHFVV